MELDYNVVRLISAEPSKIATYNGRQLKESILKSEGRVLMGQTYLPSPILIPDCMFFCIHHRCNTRHSRVIHINPLFRTSHINTYWPIAY